MSDSKPLIFYDISSPIQPRSYAPNPSKTRYALSFTRATFRTTFVEIPDIPNVRKSLDCPATRKFADGSDFNTLPILSDPVLGEVIGDSFDIANFLNQLVPRGRLFPENSKETGLDYESPHKDSPILIPLSVREGLKHGKYARFNWHVDATFTAHVILVAYYMPFNPETARATRQIFLNRSGLKSWEDMKVSGEAREDMKAAFKDSLTSLAQLYTINEGGPYLEGEQANYADLIVGGWLNMFFQCMPRDEWKEVSMWHGGVFGRLHDALQENYWECK